MYDVFVEVEQKEMGKKTEETLGRCITYVNILRPEGNSRALRICGYPSEKVFSCVLGSKSAEGEHGRDTALGHK